MSGRDRLASSVARRAASLTSRIVGMHGVGEVDAAHDPHALQIRPSRLRQHLELMLEAGFRFVTVSDFAARIGSGTLGPGLVALSFDDGMADNHDVLVPLLAEYGLPATLYIATGLLGRPNPWLDPRAGQRIMTAEEVQACARAGMEIGAHTLSHPDMSRLDRATCREEMRRSRDDLIDLTGQPVSTFAYPFGSYGPGALAAAREVGFASAVTCDRGRSFSDPVALPRVMVTRIDGQAALLGKLLGVDEPLLRSRAGSAVRSAAKRARWVWRQRRDRAAAHR